MPKLYSDHSFRRHLVVLPDDFDQWFTVNRFIPDADGVICQTGDVPSDKVVCTLQLSRVMTDPANYIFAYSLMMYVEVPESSGLDLAHLFSPIVTITRYEGDSGDANAPHWTCIPPCRIFDFHQPRHVVAELFFKLALSTDSSTPSTNPRSDMLNWASAVRWGPQLKPFPAYGCTEHPTTKATRSYDAPHYRAEKSLKTALKNAVKCRRGPDEVIIVEVSSDE